MIYIVIVMRRIVIASEVCIQFFNLESKYLRSSQQTGYPNLIANKYTSTTEYCACSTYNDIDSHTVQSISR